MDSIQEKRSKTSHIQDKSVYKQESTVVVSKTMAKDQSNNSGNSISTNETDKKVLSTLLPTTNMATITPTITVQPKKEKPTAK